MPLKISRLRLQNWKNFSKTEESNLSDISFILGANASGKSNYLDALRFLRDISKSRAGGVQDAIEKRGGLKSIRCLHARSVTEVSIEVDISRGDELAWTYLVSFGLTGSGLREPEIKNEQVIRYGKGAEAKRILSRPTSDDLRDRERLRETHLEQTSANYDFREVSEFFASITYVHLVPQLLKYGDLIGGTTLEEDPFGQEFMLRISRAPKKQRTIRLRRIEKALQTIVPQIEDLSFVNDQFTGLPHLEVRFRHHRPRGALQREDQLSDGTLRLIALLWLLQEDGHGPLLLEEPELSLNEEVVRQIPELIAKVHRQSGSQRQVFVSTHSYALLSNPGIGSSDLILIIPSLEGSSTRKPSPEEAAAMQAGLSPADVVLPAVRPSSESLQLALKF